MCRIETINNENRKIEYWYNKDILVAIKYLDAEGNLHRDSLEGPAFIMYYHTGRVVCERYFRNGIQHRSKNEGSAYIIYNHDGTIESESIWENGVCLS